ncbi:hypothetical protein EDC94DRAFT_644663 [Helicostylum pulchrum]|nr:hypothetical protein EDC94DRAFT_644663 [Helicostylum pulchrum]
MAYMYFFTDEIFSITRSPLLNVHKTMKGLSTGLFCKPDIKIPYEYKNDQILDLCIIEYTPNNSDFTKIHLAMKSMLNKLIKMNIDDPVVFGLLIQGFDCQAFKMSLNGDGFYFCPVVHFLYLPRDVSDIMIVPKVTSFFMSLKNELDQLVAKIQNKKKG